MEEVEEVKVAAPVEDKTAAKKSKKTKKVQVKKEEEDLDEILKEMGVESKIDINYSFLVNEEAVTTETAQKTEVEFNSKR